MGEDPEIPGCLAIKRTDHGKFVGWLVITLGFILHAFPTKAPAIGSPKPAILRQDFEIRHLRRPLGRFELLTVSIGLIKPLLTLTAAHLKVVLSVCRIKGSLNKRRRPRLSDVSGQLGFGVGVWHLGFSTNIQTPHPKA